MDCISIDAPQAYLIMYGAKRVENRTWQPKLALPARLYVHTTADSGGLWVVDEDLPPGALERYRAWRDRGGQHEPWMDGYHRLVLAERAHYGVAQLADVDVDAVYGRPELWFLRPASIVGWMDIVSIDQEMRDIYDQPGCYHWRIGAAGLLDAPITHVIGHQRVWRYPHGQ